MSDQYKELDAGQDLFDIDHGHGPLRVAPSSKYTRVYSGILTYTWYIRYTRYPGKPGSLSTVTVLRGLRRIASCMVLLPISPASSYTSAARKTGAVLEGLLRNITQ